MDKQCQKALDKKERALKAAALKKAKLEARKNNPTVFFDITIGGKSAVWTNLEHSQYFDISYAY